MERTAYTSTAKWFHWLIVGLVGLELLAAAVMPGAHRGTTPDILVSLHFSFGLTIIAVMLMRLLWRLTHRPPPLPAGTSRWQALAAHLMHALLYMLLFLIPFAGWGWADALGLPVTLFGFVTMPVLLPAGSSYLWLAADLHVYLAAGVIVLIGLHVLASLYHWYVQKDDTLERMLPEGALTERAMSYFNRYR